MPFINFDLFCKVAMELELDRRAAVREKQRAERREKERRQRSNSNGELKPDETDVQLTSVEAQAKVSSTEPAHERGMELLTEKITVQTVSAGAPPLSAREKLLVRKQEKNAREEADR